MPPKVTETFAYKYGVKIIVVTLAIIAVTVIWIAKTFDDNTHSRQSRLSFVEYRQDQESQKVLDLNNRVEILEAEVKRLTGKPLKEAWE